MESPATTQPDVAEEQPEGSAEPRDQAEADEPEAHERAADAMPGPSQSAAIIAIDDDDALLERLKRWAGDAGGPLHRFNVPEQVITRVQYYTLRGEVLVVVVGEGVGVESRIPDRRWDQLIERIQRMSGTAQVLLRNAATPLRVAVSNSFARDKAQDSTPEERERLVGEVLSYLGLQA